MSTNLILRVVLDVYFGLSCSLAFLSRRNILLTVAHYQSSNDLPLSYRRYFNIAGFLWFIFFSPISITIIFYKHFTGIKELK